MLNDLFTNCSAEIESAYKRLGHATGYRFLTGPRATLACTTEVGLITLNPGGGAESAWQSGMSFEPGSCYVAESWLGLPAGRAPLQRQVQALFREIMDHSGRPESVDEYLAQHVLTAHLVPFRSRSFADLASKHESLKFAHQLWSRILREWRPRVIVTIDQQAFATVAGIVTELGGRLSDLEHFDTGWGNYRCEARRYLNYRDTGSTTLARLPHLSRFTLFSEPGYTARRRGVLQPFFAWTTAQMWDVSDSGRNDKNVAE